MPAGRPRKPTELKRQAGTLQPCRTNFSEPQLPPELPAPPEGLSATVLEAYHVHGRMLLDMRVLTRADRLSLAAMAQSYCDWREAVALLEANGGPICREPIVDGSGEILGYKTKAHPAVAVRNEAERRYRGWCQSFGLTPSDRSKVSAQKEEKKSDLAKLLEMPA